jgi:hypothetical protein
MVNDTAQQKPLLAIRARFNSHSEFDYPINYTAFRINLERYMNYYQPITI